MRASYISVAGWVLSAVMGSAVSAADHSELKEFRKVIAVHIQRYPALEIQDLYKLVFQAAMGAEHAVPDRDAARQWLEREMSSLSESSPEPLVQPLSPDGALVRINLRTFERRGGQVDELLEAFVQTAAGFRGSEERLRRYWRYVESMVAAEEIPFSAEEARQWFEQMEAQAFPAVRHSDRYRESYQPAYRVILVELLGPESIAVTAE